VSEWIDNELREWTKKRDEIQTIIDALSSPKTRKYKRGGVVDKRRRIHQEAMRSPEQRELDVNLLNTATGKA
jgi:hypothetical protein